MLCVLKKTQMQSGYKVAMDVKKAIADWEVNGMTPRVQNEIETLTLEGHISEQLYEMIRTRMIPEVKKIIMHRATHIGLLAVLWYRMMVLDPQVFLHSLLQQGLADVEFVQTTRGI